MPKPIDLSGKSAKSPSIPPVAPAAPSPAAAPPTKTEKADAPPPVIRMLTDDERRELEKMGLLKPGEQLTADRLRQVQDVLGVKNSADGADNAAARPSAEEIEKAKKTVTPLAVKSLDDEVKEVFGSDATADERLAEDAPAGGTDEHGGGAPKLTHCPYCYWDLSVPNVVEVTDDDRTTYITALVLGKLFTKTYMLFDGQLQVTFRCLAVGELDACFRQVYKERVREEITSMVDYWEKVGRYRMCLQLQRLHSPGNFDHDMPDGLSLQTNPGAIAYWEVPADDPEPLRRIEQYVSQNILKSESMFRIVNRLCSEFNRLVARLEVLSQRPGFTKPTASQSP